MNNSVKLNGTVIQGGPLKYPKTPDLIIGEDNGYMRGDILDANATIAEIKKGGGGEVDPAIIDELRQEINTKADSNSVYTKQEIDSAGYLTEHQDISGKADKSEIPTKVSDLTNDSQFITELAIEGMLQRIDEAYTIAVQSEQELTTKVDSEYAMATFATREYIDDELNTKVDKVEDKGLSANDFTDEYKQKLDEIGPIEEQVQSDWSENDVNSKAYILNRTHYTWTEVFEEEIEDYGIGWSFDNGQHGYPYENDRIFLCDRQGTHYKPDIFTFTIDDGDTDHAIKKSSDGELKIYYKLYKNVKINGYDVCFTGWIDEEKPGSSTHRRYIFLRTADNFDDCVKLTWFYYDYGDYNGGDIKTEAASYNRYTINLLRIRQLDNKYLSLDGSLIPGSNNPVTNNAVATAISTLNTSLTNNYYTKTNTYSKTQVDAIMDAARNGLFVLISDLDPVLPEPSVECTGKIYLLPVVGELSNYYDEYICITQHEEEVEPTYQWEKIGSTTINLDEYYTKQEIHEVIDESRIKPDWNENDPNNANYIQNRTHYSYIEDVVYEEVPVNDSEVYVTYPFREGKYIVNTDLHIYSSTREAFEMYFETADFEDPSNDVYVAPDLGWKVELIDDTVNLKTTFYFYEYYKSTETLKYRYITPDGDLIDCEQNIAEDCRIPELNSVDGIIKVYSGVLREIINKIDPKYLDLSSKQNTLISGTNIKTVNNTSLLGSGNIDTANVVSAPALNTFIISQGDDTLTVNNTTNGVHIGATSDGGLSDYIDEELPSKTYVDNSLSDKQDTLISGTNIKTVSGNSLLGSGDIDAPILSSSTKTVRIENNNIDIEFVETSNGMTVDGEDSQGNSICNAELTSKQYVDNSVNNKMLKISSPTKNNVLITDENGQAVDGGISISELAEPFRVIQFNESDVNIQIPYCTEEVENVNITNADFNIYGQEAEDYRIVGMFGYEMFDSNNKRINCWPVCQFTMNNQTTLRTRWMCGGTSRKTINRTSVWLLLKHR